MNVNKLTRRIPNESRKKEREEREIERERESP